jgi:hypothetical protein
MGSGMFLAPDREISGLLHLFPGGFESEFIHWQVLFGMHASGYFFPYRQSGYLGKSHPVIVADKTIYTFHQGNIPLRDFYDPTLRFNGQSERLSQT